MASKTSIGQAYVQIMPSAEGIKGSVSKILDGETKSAGSAAGSNIVSGIKKMMGAAALGKVLVESLKLGAALEQSLGGVETLFGDFANDVKANAEKAFSSAGLSANEYMETATSFAAALNASLRETEGGIERSAALTDMAVTDMADNANKMGTPMESIQAAYAGFAKQQYTLLDNLKIGYGGTKTEMERLLSDASKISGVKYDISNLADVYEAIHVIQEDLGVTGATAKEASTTLEGSFKAMTAAGKNLVADLVLGRDVGTDMTNLINTTATAIFGNLLPAIGRIITSLPVALGTALTQGIPTLLNNAQGMISQLNSGILARIPEFVETGSTMIVSFVGSFLSALPQFLETGFQIVVKLGEGIINNLPALTVKAWELIAALLAEIGTHLPEILQKGIELVGELASGIVEGIPTLIEKLPEVFQGIKDAFSGYDWLQIGKDILNGIGEGIKNAVGGLITTTKEAASNLIEGVKARFGISSPSKVMAEEVGKWIPAGVAVGIEKNMHTVSDAMNGLQAIATGSFNANISPYETTAGTTTAELQTQIQALSSAITAMRDNPTPVILQGDAAGVFKIVRNQNTRYKKMTGAGAF